MNRKFKLVFEMEIELTDNEELSDEVVELVKKHSLS
jgi:hypothetical protein